MLNPVFSNFYEYHLSVHLLFIRPDLTPDVISLLQYKVEFSVSDDVVSESFITTYLIIFHQWR